MNTSYITGAALLLPLKANFFLLGSSCFSCSGGGGYKRSACREGKKV